MQIQDVIIRIVPPLPDAADGRLGELLSSGFLRLIAAENAVDVDFSAQVSVCVTVPTEKAR